MALIQCPECGRSVSSTIPACIHCGYSLVEHVKVLGATKGSASSKTQPQTGTPVEYIEESTSSQLIKETAGELGKKVNQSTYPLFKFLLHQPLRLLGSIAALASGILLIVWAIPLFGSQCAVLLNSWAKLTYKGSAVDIGKTFSDAVETMHLPVYLNAFCFPQTADTLMAALEIYKMPLSPVGLGVALFIFGGLLILSSFLAFTNVVRTYIGKPAISLTRPKKNSDSKFSKSKFIQSLKGFQLWKLSKKATRAVIALVITLLLILVYVLSYSLPHEISVPVSSPSPSDSALANSPEPSSATGTNSVAELCDPNASDLSSLEGVWDRPSNGNAFFAEGLWLKVVRVSTSSRYEAVLVQATGLLDPKVVGSATMSGNSSCFQLAWHSANVSNGTTKGSFDGATLSLDCPALNLASGIFGSDGCNFVAPNGYTGLSNNETPFTTIFRYELATDTTTTSKPELTLWSEKLKQRDWTVPMYLETVTIAESNQAAQFVFADLGDGAGRVWWQTDVPSDWAGGVDASYSKYGHTGDGWMTFSVDCSTAPSGYFGVAELNSQDCEFSKSYTY